MSASSPRRSKAAVFTYSECCLMTTFERISPSEVTIAAQVSSAEDSRPSSVKHRFAKRWRGMRLLWLVCRSWPERRDASIRLEIGQVVGEGGRGECGG